MNLGRLEAKTDDIAGDDLNRGGNADSYRRSGWLEFDIGEGLGAEMLDKFDTCRQFPLLRGSDLNVLGTDAEGDVAR